MQLESARALKAELLEELHAPSAAARSAAARRRPAPPALERALPIALGVQGRGQDYKLAVRIQGMPVGIQQAIDTLRLRAQGEIDVRLIGRIHKQPSKTKKPWHQQKIRPLQPGLSVGHVDITAGTLGCFVIPTGARTPVFILSNNHVLANENKAKKGDSIIQPGRADGGQNPSDLVARLSKFIKLKKHGNSLDAAVAALEEGLQYNPSLLRGLGKINGLRTEPLDVGETVYKVGRTTGLTRGYISALEVDNLIIGYDRGDLVFDGQIEIAPKGNEPFSLGGDSGSLIVDEQFRAIGLLFAGNDFDVTYANPIQSVIKALNVQLLF